MRRSSLLRRLAVIVALVTVTGIGNSVGTANASPATTGRRLQLIVEPDDGMTPIYRLLADARRRVDLVIYELVDRRAESILAGDARRGVRVRVLLDRRDEQEHNAAAYTYLASHGVEVRWASSRAVELTHEKAVVIDAATALIMTLNLVADEEATTRDFAVVDHEPADVAAIEQVFQADWNSSPIVAPRGADLVWSPNAEAALVALIDGAHHSLLIENEEMRDPYILSPLIAAARRGVGVDVVMTTSTSSSSSLAMLSSAGVHVRTFPPSASLYIHAKVIVADAGYGNEQMFLGSQNFSITSLLYNRELGLITTDSAVSDAVAAIVRSDFSLASSLRG